MQSGPAHILDLPRGIIAAFPSETFETAPEHEYFRLHRGGAAACASCPDVTCHCPYGLDVPGSLVRLHAAMVELRGMGRVPDGSPPVAREGVEVVSLHVPARTGVGGRSACRVWVGNRTNHPWRAGGSGATAVEARVDGSLAGVGRLRQDLHPGGRGHFAFELAAPERSGHYALTLVLREGGPGTTATVIHSASLAVE